jgi:thiol-disulfide isomerase/thioredoxin
MYLTRITLNVALCTALVSLAAPWPAVAQEQENGQCPGKIEALKASYQQQLRAIECRWIAELTELAEKATGAEADAAYRQLFQLATARSLLAEAQAAAGRCLSSASGSRDVRAPAALVQVLARAEKGEHDRALADWKALFHEPMDGEQSAPGCDGEIALAVGEVYFQRLIRGGRYDVAHKVCELACEDHAPPALKEHFEARMAKLHLVGKPAPPIAGTDLDGHRVSLADLRGKVVLVDFWASWCSPCVASIPALNSLARKYGDRDFVILGINVDRMHEDVREVKDALPIVRRFLVKHGVTWNILLNGQGTDDFTAAYGVEQIPANFLVSRDGMIIAVEQSSDGLERAVGRALGGLAGCHYK